MVPPGVRLGIVRAISYGLFGKPDTFVPQLRELGATLVRVYFYWSQIEPEPGQCTFDTVDAFLDQLDGSEEVWVTVCSSSRWATQQATDFLPPSPASAPDSPERQFFDVLLRDGRDFFDLFDLHLYGEAERVLADIETARAMMRAFGYEKPLVAGEYNAPSPNLYPEATAASSHGDTLPTLGSITASATVPTRLTDQLLAIAIQQGAVRGA